MNQIPKRGAQCRHFKLRAKIKVKKGWSDAGRTGVCVGPSIFVEQWWTVVLWDDADDPTTFKTDALEIDDAKLCFCGHPESNHTRYKNGTNSKGSPFICTKDGCDKWAYCDLKDR